MHCGERIFRLDCRCCGARIAKLHAERIKKANQRQERDQAAVFIDTFKKQILQIMSTFWHGSLPDQVRLQILLYALLAMIADSIILRLLTGSMENGRRFVIAFCLRYPLFKQLHVGRVPFLNPVSL